MHRRIVVSTCAAAVLSLAVVSAQAKRVTVTGCLMRGTGTQSAGWILSTPIPAASRSGSPSNERIPTATNRNGAAGIGVSGSTSTAIATSGSSIDSEVNGAGVAGATDQNGSTVGAGATAAATSGATSDERPAPGASTSARGATSYQLSGVRNPTQYANKRVEVMGTISRGRGNANSMLRATSVKVVGDCQ